MNTLVAVDWGTSSLRAARLGPRGEVLEERSSPQGILHVPPEGFATVFEALCADWTRAGSTFCLMSGMIGSRQGWLEAPYCPCPAGFDSLTRHLAWVQPGRTAIVPGLSCERGNVPDVMRGEEVQVFGALQLLGLEDGLLVLPGTHSKWVRVERGHITSFSTFMTGEFYALLRQHSLLARSLPAEDGPLDIAAFERGLALARSGGSLLASAFSVRTLALFDRMATTALPSYLSGLVIGEELHASLVPGDQNPPVVVIGSPTLTERYVHALRFSGVEALPVGAQATWQGLWAIARNLNL